MSRFNDGEYINLVWDGPPDAYYVKGHVSNEDGKEALVKEAYLDEEQIEELGQAEHMYGRWSMEPGEDGGQQCLRDYMNPGRGRFKVTRFGVGIFAKNEKEVE